MVHLSICMYLQIQISTNTDTCTCGIVEELRGHLCATSLESVASFRVHAQSPGHVVAFRQGAQLHPHLQRVCACMYRCMYTCMDTKPCVHQLPNPARPPHIQACTEVCASCISISAFECACMHIRPCIHTASIYIQGAQISPHLLVDAVVWKDLHYVIEMLQCLGLVPVLMSDAPDELPNLVAVGIRL